MLVWISLYVVLPKECKDCYTFWFINNALWAIILYEFKQPTSVETLACGTSDKDKKDWKILWNGTGKINYHSEYSRVRNKHQSDFNLSISIRSIIRVWLWKFLQKLYYKIRISHSNGPKFQLLFSGDNNFLAISIKVWSGIREVRVGKTTDIHKHTGYVYFRLKSTPQHVTIW